ncbi:MAG: outer membrane protein assembly factor BamD [Bacteroidota bacterium]|nr:outer membrane protein assembly factor BamD [Bacteroidota bacterium]
MFRILTSLILLFFICISCSKFAKVQKSDNLDYKYKSAVKYYQNKEYYKSGTLFEELIPTLKGQADAEKAQFYYAYSQYYQGQLIMSAYYFKRFYETYPRSEFAEEAYFMHCMSLYEDSPDYELDQTNTYAAISSFQTFLNIFPGTKYIDQCNSLIDKLNYKLELKAYHQAKLFYKMHDYRAGVISFENFTKDYPNSKYLEEVAFLKIEAQYTYANISIDSKKRERFNAGIDYYYYFIDKYPNSRQIKAAEAIYEKIQIGIAKLDHPTVEKKKWWQHLI